MATIDGQAFTLGTIKLGVGRKLRKQYPDTEDFNIAFIVESLKAGGNADASTEWLEENVNYFNGDFNELLLEAFQVNGLNVEKPKPGEEMPPVEAVTVDSTSTTSTGL